MINYILQVILFQVLFLAIYDFFLSKETFFTKNRWYLLTTPILSFLIPLIKIPTFQKAVPREFIVHLPEIVLNPDKVIQQTIEASSFTESLNYMSILFWMGVAVFSALFLIKLVKIINFIKIHEVVNQNGFKLILLPNETKAFSFFNYIFLGKEIPISQQEKIIQHELVHSQQNHSLDLLFFEILKIAMWFNPMIYIYQKRITLVHEYISDAVVAKTDTKETYINNLLSSFFQLEDIAFVNQFCKQSFIKKRILMMTKIQSKKMNQLKYLVLIPVLMSMLFYSSCSENDIELVPTDHLVLEKSPQITYMEMGREVIVGTNLKETYLDRYLGNGTPEGIEVTYNDLNSFEREEFDVAYESMKPRLESSENNGFKTIKIYEKKNGRKTLAFIVDFSNFKKRNVERKPLADGSYSVLHVQKTPTFGGCEIRDLSCFFTRLDAHFKNNFDLKKANSLGLSPGKTKALVSFNIDTSGNATDIEVKASHNEIKKEVVRVIKNLPQMTIGENNGQPVEVKYTLPFSFYID